ncbi:MAG: hypothetical protein IT306_12715 [Chloroflexi bacterium]|nr:hypothetical protein [Chloroflexota bacterium]
MVTEEVAASPLWGDEPSILARLREWTAQHSLRPEHGGPPALCPPGEIPIYWVRCPEDPHLPPLLAPTARSEQDEVAAADRFVDALEQASAATDAESLAQARAQLYATALDVQRATRPLIYERLSARRIKRRLACPQACWLLEQARHGEAAMTGIMLTWVVGHRCQQERLGVLARHPWLWSAATRTLDSLGGDGDALDLWWARIHRARCCDRRRLLREVAPRLDVRPDIRQWVLLHGMRTWPGDLYIPRDRGNVVDLPFEPCVAAACAVAGDLAGTLDSPDVSDEMLEIARALVWNMFPDMHEEDLETCPDGVLIIDRLMGHLLDRAQTLTHLRLTQRILGWLEWPPDQDAGWQEEQRAVWERRASLGWTEEVRASLADDCERIQRRLLLTGPVGVVVASGIR